MGRFISSDPDYFNEILFKQNIVDSTVLYNSRLTSTQDTFRTDPPDSIFYFDPNNLSIYKWQMLGLEQRVINTLKNYEKKGGHFYKNKDLLKIYGFSIKDFTRLEPYIRIKDKREKRESKRVHYNKSKDVYSKLKIDINLADSATFTLIKGIGPVYSARIIKYRNLLGGYANREQLLEVYGIDSGKFKKIKPFLYVVDANLRLININNVSFDQLKKHPYISEIDARRMIDHRRGSGNFSNVRDIVNYGLVSEESFERIKPYLTIHKKVNK